MSGRQSLNAVIARMVRDGTLSPLPDSPERAPAAPPREALGPPEAGALVTGHPNLTVGNLAAWERVRADVRARNLAMTAQDVVRQRARIDALRAPVATAARASLAAELSTWRSVEQSRAEARAWASANQGAADRLEEIQAAARQRADAGEAAAQGKAPIA